jgi:hypothetical protein
VEGWDVVAWGAVAVFTGLDAVMTAARRARGSKAGAATLVVGVRAVLSVGASDGARGFGGSDCGAVLDLGGVGGST